LRDKIDFSRQGNVFHSIHILFAVQVARHARVVAVLGIKTKKQERQPAYFVPEYLQEQCGKRIIPVPVYFPEATHILGEPVVRNLKDIREQVDILDVFRPPAALDNDLAKDIVAMNPRPKVVWLQVGIRNDDFEKKIILSGIDLVVDACLKVEASHDCRM
jgi:predicted CoA-binding protein